MFEKSHHRPEPTPPLASEQIALSDGEPMEFTYRGRRYRIYAVLSRWREAGEWWNRASDGKYRPDDGARALWKVEAAPLGVMGTFEIERIDKSETNKDFIWRIRPASRSNSLPRSE
jgi:hypothetical protein